MSGNGWKVFAFTMMVVLGTWSGRLWAVMASPHPFVETQPDGTQIILRVHGDEQLNWLSDDQGYPVVREASGWFAYAELDGQGRLQPTALRVGRDQPAGLKRGARPRFNAAGGAGRVMSVEKTAAPQRVATTGTVKNLEVLIRFSDHVDKALPSQAQMDNLFNHLGATHTSDEPTGSVKEIYLENSYNQLTLNTTVTAWITLSQTEAYYADGVSGSSKLWEGLKEALQYLDDNNLITFKDFDQDNDGRIDAIGFIHSGYGAEWNGDPDRIWSHRWTMSPAWVSSDGVSVSDYHIEPALWGTSGSQIGRVGVTAHEIGHFLGLPDLYDRDRDYSSRSRGLGSWGMMANSWGFDGSQQYPPHFSAWSKVQLNWVTPTLLTADGTYNIGQVETNAQIYKIQQGYPSGEYLLIENRQPVGSDQKIPQGGLAVWHIDEAKSSTQNDDQGYPGQAGWPENNKHYQVALLQADGLYNLEKDDNSGDSGDMWHSGSVLQQMNDASVPDLRSYQNGTIANSNNTLLQVSAAGSQMSFCLNTCNVTPGTPAGPMDVDGNGEYDALTDGLLAIRYLLGLRGSVLLDRAVAANCSRCTAAEIEAYIATTLTP